MKQDYNITVGELRRNLAHFDDGTEVTFGELTFYRTKRRGPNLVQIEFNEVCLLGRIFKLE